MNTEQFFKKFRELPGYTQRWLLDYVDTALEDRPLYWASVPNDLMTWLDNNTHVNRRYLEKSLVGTERA